MDVRIDEQTLKNMESDRETQALVGIVRDVSQPIEAFQFQIKQAQGFLRQSKFDVAAFLGMLSFDLGKTDTMIDWLAKRLLKLPGTDKWHAQSHYLLGRAYEQQGKVQEAIEEYKFDKSPQAAGNRIRIRKLNALIESK
jgi:tetratricopeptide (TPR) repeat protein